MKRVFILGAGASKSYAQSPTGLRMPVSRDFFETFEALPASHHPWVLREGLVHYLKLIRMVDPLDFLRSGIDIEELHSEILERLQDTQLDMPPGGHLTPATAMLWRAYNEMIFLFCFCLNCIQNGPLSKAHVELAKLLSVQDTVVTFNWDTLLDRAMADVTEWTIEAGYGRAAKAVYRDGWQEVTGANARSSPKLLKLHGSTNWLVGYPTPRGGRLIHTQSAAPESLHIFETATEPYPTYAGRFMAGFGPYSYGYYPPNLEDKGIPASEGYVLLRVRQKVPWKPEGQSVSHGLVSMPLVVPPVKDKSYELFGGLFSHLWHVAEKELARANEVVIIGYSFPRTDHRSSKLILKALLQRSDVPRFKVLDPAPERIVEKLVMEFGIPSSAITVVKERFTVDFDCRRLLDNQ